MLHQRSSSALSRCEKNYNTFNKSVWPSAKLICLVVVWFSASVFNTITNKALMEKRDFPLTLTGFHLIAGITFNLALSRPRKNDKMSASYSQILPCASLMIASKVFTYVSYGRVPASLTHTVKATSPIFSVLISHYHLKQPVSPCVVIALFPIMIGVTLSSVTEINFEVFGFFAAVLSTLIGVFQNICTKKALKVEANPVLLNLHVNVWAFMMLVFAGMFIEFPRLYQSWLEEPEEIVNNENAQMLLYSMMGFYIQSISSIFVLKHVTAVTHQVSATIKRLVIIVTSVWYFRNPVNFINAIGVALAVAGFFTYGYLNKKLSKPEPVCISSSKPQSNRDRAPQIVVDVAHKFRANNEFVNGVRGVMSEVFVPLKAVVY